MPAPPLAAALRVARKELVSSFRDRQTVLYTFVLPLAMYPALFWVMLQGYAVVRGRDAETEVTVALLGDPGGTSLDDVHAALEDPGGVASGQPAGELREPGPVVVVTPDAPATEEEAKRLLTEEKDGPAADAVLFFGDGPPQLLHEGTRSHSVLARKRVEERIGRLADSERRDAVHAAGGDWATLAPFRVERVDLATEEDKGGRMLSFILPLTFVVMTLFGALFPAIDLTAGEKERNSAETTLLLPVPRLSVQLGKVLTVTVTAAIATSLNLVGMALAAEHLLAGVPGRPITIEIPWLALASLAPVALAYLLGTSAFLLAAASFTRTFKQGQSLIGALQLLFIVPALVGIMPNVELTPGLALVPVIQTVLALKALLNPAGTEGLLLCLSLVMVSQLVYAALAVLVSVRLSSRESLLLGGSSLRGLGRLLRSAGAPR